MIKNLCECDICGTIKFFDSSIHAFPSGWGMVSGNEENETINMCPECYAMVKGYIRKIHLDTFDFGGESEN